MTLDLSLLPDGGVNWLDASGEHADIVLSSRIRLARNLEGFAFPARAREGERLRVLAQVREAVTRAPASRTAVLVRVDELAGDDRLLLHERHLVSTELAGLDPQHPVRSGAAVFLGRRLERHGERGGSPAAAGAALRLRPGGAYAAIQRLDASWARGCRTRSTRSSASSRRARRTPARGCARRC